MKRRTLTLTVVAGGLVFLAVLVLYLPASWFASRLPPQVRCAELGGSVWAGECLGLEAQGARVGDALWNLSPLRALAGKLVGDVDLRGDGLTARADVDMKLDGAGVIRNLEARFRMDSPLGSQVFRNQQGQVEVSLQKLELSAPGQPRSLQGVLRLRDFRQTGAQPMELGSYEVAFDGATRADGSSVGQLRDTGGPFDVKGTLTFAPPDSYLVHGSILGRTPQAQGIVRQITLGAPPDASGRNEFRFEGSF